MRRNSNRAVLIGLTVLCTVFSSSALFARTVQLKGAHYELTAEKFSPGKQIPVKSFYLVHHLYNSIFVKMRSVQNIPTSEMAEIISAVRNHLTTRSLITLEIKLQGRSTASRFYIALRKSTAGRYRMYFHTNLTPYGYWTIPKVTSLSVVYSREFLLVDSILLRKKQLYSRQRETNLKRSKARLELAGLYLFDEYPQNDIGVEKLLTTENENVYWHYRAGLLLGEYYLSRGEFKKARAVARQMSQSLSREEYSYLRTTGEKNRTNLLNLIAIVEKLQK